MPLRPDVWDDLCGWYRLSARLSDVRLRGMMDAAIEVFVRRGRLMLRFLTPIPTLARGFALHPEDADDPFALRIDLSDVGIDAIRVVFGRDGARGGGQLRRAGHSARPQEPPPSGAQRRVADGRRPWPAALRCRRVQPIRRVVLPVDSDWHTLGRPSWSILTTPGCRPVHGDRTAAA